MIFTLFTVLRFHFLYFSCYFWFFSFYNQSWNCTIYNSAVSIDRLLVHSTRLFSFALNLTFLFLPRTFFTALFSTADYHNNDRMHAPMNGPFFRATDEWTRAYTQMWNCQTVSDSRIVRTFMFVEKSHNSTYKDFILFRFKNLGTIFLYFLLYLLFKETQLITFWL